MKKDSSFAPLVDAGSRILIVGSFPGKESLRQKQYYAHKRNLFWKLVAEALGRRAPAGYRGKKAMLSAAGIALWDVVSACRRENSDDSKIRSAELNDIPDLLKKRKKLRAVFFNGRTAEKIFRDGFRKGIAVPAFYLPSTSPANASLAYKDKLAEWKKIKPYLRSADC
jgi:hypoxanthine-DNA glycosylase